VTESSTSSGATPGGTPGTDTNVPQYTQTDTGSGTISSDRSDKTRNYEIDKTETVTQFAMGDTKYDYLTVSVLVNSAGTLQLKLGDTEAEKVDKIRSIVATAVGLRENRSNENVSLQDNISVAFMDFYSEPIPEPENQSGVKAVLSSPYMAVIAVVAVLAVVLLLIAGRRKRERDKSLEEIQQSGFEAVVDDEISIEDLFDKNLTPEEKENQKIKQEIDKLIKDNPESAAQVIKTWLLEE
jgi:flagellar M-ring protein FliF